MPTYEYLCQACSNRFEQWQHMTDDALTICPECGGHIRRVFFPAGIVFKGSGFYKTDHGSSTSTVAEANGNGNNGKSEPTTPETKTSGDNSSTSTESGKSSSSPSKENKAPAATTVQ